MKRLPIRRVCGWRLRTNHGDSEPGGPRIYSHGQKSWDKFALFPFLRTLQTRILLPLRNLAPDHSPPPPPPPLQYNFDYLYFLLIFNVALGGEGKRNTFLKGKQCFFA